MKLFSTSPLFGFLLRNLALGVAVGWSLVGLLLWSDRAPLRLLLSSAESPLLALALLLFGVTVTFGSVAMGTAIFLLPGISDGPDEER